MPVKREQKWVSKKKSHNENDDDEIDFSKFKKR